ncbi:MAG: hypothetical protein WC005_09330 [Candidatus Nanopelagicales bacterium]
MPRRAALGLERAAVLGLSLIGRNSELQGAIRRHLAEARSPIAAQRQARLGEVDGRALRTIESKRRKLLDLYYTDKISPDLFAQEDQRLKQDLERAQVELASLHAEESRLESIAARFEDVATVLAQLDIESAWDAATAQERRVLVEELLTEVSLFPDHLEVEVSGVPRINVLLEEVGLAKVPRGGTNVQSVCVRGGT